MNDSTPAPAAAAVAPAAPARLVRQARVLVPLLLSALVVHLYQMESPAFLQLFLLAIGGFLVHTSLPLARRLPFFVLLSVAGAVVMLGVVDAAWLLACGLVLIGIAAAPLPGRVRVTALLGFGGLLAAARAGLLPVPWSAAMWPTLGSMFMFRLVLYLLSPPKDRDVWSTLGYFFMLPNLAFPLFPVVDYQTFRRTYFDRDKWEIYEQGGLWIARGLVHLLLYRYVYQRVLNDPIDVVRLSDLVQFMVGTFLLYLRVSGQFHLVIGLLHLFGFRLPETHKLYYLAHSFTELWRRINIYWTEFMMKAVFYPTYFRVKKLGPSGALVVATSAVFLVTWILHSYQWFWLRGGFPITAQDTLFWGILGALVVSGALRELKAPKRARLGRSGWNLRLGLQAMTTFAAFCFLWSLWSTESVTEWLWMLGAVTEVDAAGVALVIVTLGTVLALGGRQWDTPPAGGGAWARAVRDPLLRSAIPLLVLLLLGQPAVMAVAPRAVGDGVAAMQSRGLNARDAALQHRGYYEQLEVRAQPNAEVLDVVGSRENWQNLAMTGALEERNDFLTRDLKPSTHVEWNGLSFTTNRWGMRDQDYEREKPARTLRVAILGPSHVMGNGVADGETFEALVESRLNAGLRLPGYDRVEILNFGVDGFAITQQVGMLEQRVLAFAPDVVIATHYHRNQNMVEGHLLKLVERGVVVLDPDLHAILEDAGLVDVDSGEIPIPFAPARALARRAGLSPRMPGGEAGARARRVADRVLAWAFNRLASTTRARGITTAVLALNVVIDDEPDEVPNREVIEAAGLPLIDLFHIYPETQRAALRIAPWDDHPNAAGHRLIADRLYPELAALLQKAAARPAAH